MLRVFLAGVVAMALANPAQSGQRRLTLSDAERLVRAAAPETATRPPRLYLEEPATEPKKGAKFDIWAKTADGLVRQRTLLVDLDSAEVWDGASCEPLTGRKLQTLQQAMRRKLDVSAIEVSRARSLAQRQGCSNLVDPGPKPGDLHAAELIKIDSVRQGASYRYTVMSGGCGYVGASSVPIKVREGAIRFAIAGNSLYIMDDDGTIRELHYELQFLPPVAPRKQ